MKTCFIITIISLLCLTSPSRQYISNEKYLINNSKCKIPDLPPFSSTLNLTRYEAISCTNFDPLLSYISVKNGTSWLNIRQEALIRYFGNPYSIRCCYSYVYRNGIEELPDVGVLVTDCKEFYFSVELKHDLVWVSCSKWDNHQSTLHGFPMTPVYENVHQVITITENVKQKTIKRSEKRPISVLMIVIDSVSRLNFIRTMPLTKQFVTSRNFYEFKGYNKVADNTYPNAMAFLTGLNYTDSIKTCQPTEINGLMNCPFIWYKYRDSGYVTAYGEDWSPIATFNYQKKGFKDPPTDYYFKPYMDAITFLESKWQDTMPFCAGPESQGSRILNLAHDFADQLKHLPTFGVFWMNTFSHNYIMSPSTMDRNVRNFFAKLEDSQILNESVVILLSDHGIRFGEINNTTRGFYELRLPMHFISLPQWFKDQFPVEAKNFEDNTEKLTSNYDLYMTLEHILKLSGSGNNYNVTSARACPRCKSFFEEIPTERSCEEAGIPQVWCTCNAFKKI